jgi:hypothetical protein
VPAVVAQVVGEVGADLDRCGDEESGQRGQEPEAVGLKRKGGAYHYR